MARDRVRAIEVSIVQFDGMSGRVDAEIGRGPAGLDRDVERGVDIGTRDLIRLPCDIAGGNP